MINGMSETQQPKGEYFVAGDSEYSQLKHPDGYIRSGRDLESYKRIFGEDFGKQEELILDVGAGDATMADEMEALTGHQAKVIRFDRDYNQFPPFGEAPAVAGDATKMPFAAESIDRVVSHNMMYYLGREKGFQAIGEMLRVLKLGGEAAIYPAKPFGSGSSDIGHINKHGMLNFPNLIITKPTDFNQWSEERKKEAYQELANAVTGGETTTKMIHWGVNKAINRKGTHRTIERGNSSSL